LTRDEIEARHPRWLADGRRPEGWEPDDALVARAGPALQDVAAALTVGGTAIVVSHGGVIRAVAHHFGAVPAPVPNLGGVWLHVEGEGLVLGARTSLLDEPATPSPTVTAAD
jgi:broad specificity phosphatase PhoE